MAGVRPITGGRDLQDGAVGHLVGGAYGYFLFTFFLDYVDFVFWGLFFIHRYMFLIFFYVWEEFLRSFIEFFYYFLDFSKLKKNYYQFLIIIMIILFYFISYLACRKVRRVARFEDSCKISWKDFKSLFSSLLKWYYKKYTIFF